MTKDNRGFSLVELVVVISIILVLSAATALGVGMLTGKDAQECIKKLYTEINSDRQLSLSKADVKLTVQKTSDGYYAVESVGTETPTKSKIAGENVAIYYSLDEGTSWSEVTGNLDLKFDRASGALAEPAAANTLRIKAVKNSKEYELRIYGLTGKTEILD